MKAGATCELAFISKDPAQNILRKFKKPRKLRQGLKILISVFFFVFFERQCQKLIPAWH